MNEKDRREHVRLEFFAQVQVTSASDIFIMSAHNISRGGIFLKANPTEYPEIKVGSIVEMQIFSSENPEQASIDLTGQVVRIEDKKQATLPTGFGLQFVKLTSMALSNLEKILRQKQLSKKLSAD